MHMRGLILFVLIASVPATSCFATSARRARPASIVALPVVVDGPEAIGCYRRAMALAPFMVPIIARFHTTGAV